MDPQQNNLPVKAPGLSNCCGAMMVFDLRNKVYYCPRCLKDVAAPAGFLNTVSPITVGQRPTDTGWSEHVLLKWELRVRLGELEALQLVDNEIQLNWGGGNGMSLQERIEELQAELKRLEAMEVPSD